MFHVKHFIYKVLFKTIIEYLKNKDTKLEVINMKFYTKLSCCT